MIEEKHDPPPHNHKDKNKHFAPKNRLTVYDILNHTPAAERNDIIENAIGDIKSIIYHT